MCVWGGALQLQCKSESARCSEKQQSPCEGDGGGGLHFERKNARIQKSPHLRKNGHMFPCILYFFIHPQPYNIGPARQQPRNWGSLLISLSLVGEGGTAISY